MKDKTPQANEVATWYNQRYATGLEQAFGRPAIESMDRLQRLQLKGTGLNILDVGAGQGYFVRAAQEQGHHSIGIDIAVEGAKIAASLTGARFAVADGQRLPFADGVFDVVTFWGTLEHHPDMAQALRECQRVIKRGGLVAIRVPNRNFWLYRVAALFGLQGGTEQQDVIEHLLNQEEWQQLFEQHGFQVISLQPDDWFVRNSIFDTHGLLAKLKMLIRKLSIAVAPLRYTYVFDFICQFPEA